MVLSSKLYPYPVLNEFSNDYVESEFTLDISCRKLKKSLEFNFEVFLTDIAISELIDSEAAEIVIHIECPQTCYRKLYKFNEYNFNIILDSNLVNEVVEICPFIISSKDLNNFKSSNFNPIYEDLSFQIEKYNVLAVGRQVNFEIEKDYDSLKNVKSIFAIIPNYEEKNVVLNDYSDDTICIKVPYDQFITYKSFGKFPENIPVIHSVLIIPILVEIFEKLKNDVNSWDDLEDRRWFKALQKAFTKKQVSFDKESLSTFDSFKSAQLIIESPILTVFKNMEIFSGGEDDL